MYVFGVSKMKVLNLEHPKVTKMAETMDDPKVTKTAETMDDPKAT